MEVALGVREEEEALEVVGDVRTTMKDSYYMNDADLCDCSARGGFQQSYGPPASVLGRSDCSHV